MEDNRQEKTIYLLKYMDDYIESLIYKVLEDSDGDPQYSAVTASNLLKCYIDVMSGNNCRLPYQNMKEYFDFHLLTEEEYALFLRKFDIEKAYYVGKIY